MCARLLRGNREVSALPWAAAPGAARGRPEAEARDARCGEVGPTQSTAEVGEQRGLCCGGADGGKGWDQGECGLAKHGPDAEPESRVPGAGPHTRSRQQEQEGKADGAPAPRLCRLPACGILRVEEARCSRHRSGDMGPVRGEPRREPERPSPPGPDRSVSSVAVTRTYIPKADGKQRPLGIAAIEDKIVQAAVVMILTPIYEAEFLGLSD